MKKYIFGAVFSLALLASPAFTQAATLTYAQINAIVSLLQSFGADQTTINNVQNSLNGGTTTGGGGTKQWCYTFKNDLTIGITENDDLLALSHAMALSGIDGGGIQIFNEDVAAAVVKFQAKYGIRQTGYVGPITRAKLNALYGCNSNTNISFSLAPIKVVRNQSYNFTANISGAPANSPILFHLQRPDGFAHISGAPTNHSTDSSGNAVIYNVLVGILGHDGQWTAWVSVNGIRSNQEFVNVSSTVTQPSITVLSPNGGEQWQKGSTQNITWNPTGAGMIDIRLVSYYPPCTGTVCPMYYPVPAEYVIATQTANDGVFEWGVGKSLDGKEISEGKYFARISMSIGAHEVRDESDAPFSIVAPNTITPTITSISPNQGTVGTVVTIYGTNLSGADGVEFYTSEGNFVAGWPLSSANSTSVSFTIDKISAGMLGSNTYQVSVVTNSCAGGCNSNRLSFTLTAFNPVITVLHPTPGMTFTQGQPMTISWQSLGNPSASYTLGYSASGPEGKGVIGTQSAAQAHCDAADKCYISWTPTFSSQSVTLFIKDSVSGLSGAWGAIAIVAAPPVSTPITLSSITPSSGPVGTSVRLDGCGSDSTSGFTLVYSGPKSGTASISVETLGAASGCGYMTFSVPTDFPAGTYTLSVKNNQTGAMSTNSVAFTVTSSYYPATLSIFPTSFVAGSPAIITVANAAPNATIKVFCRDPNGAVCDDSVSYTTNSSGQFSHTYNTAGWTVGTYRSWVTGNSANPFWSWRSVDVGFTVTAPAQSITISRTPSTSLASPFKVGDATVSSSVNTPSLFASNLTGTGYNQIGTNAPRTFTFTTFDLVNSGACNATTGICNMPGNWDAASFACPAGLGVGTTQYMTEWYTIGNVTSNKLNWYFKCSGTVTSMGAYTNPGLASALGAFGGATNSTSQSTSDFTYVWNRDLQIGSLYPDDIAALQQALTREGVYAGEITGGFYNQTYAAVKAFQEKYGINQTGYVGQLTRAQLNTLFAR